MGAAKRKPIDEAQLRGFKYFKKMLPLLDRLHEAGCQRDKAGQRDLHYDQYCALVLLYLLNPIVTSMRGLVQASTLQKVRRKLGVSPTSLGSFSEAVAVFDPSLIQAVVAELAGELKSLPHDRRLDDVPGLLTLVVCRIRDNSVYSLVEERPLTGEAQAAGVMSDQVVRLGCAYKSGELKQPVRIIRVACAPHKNSRHGGRGGPAAGEFLLIATDMLDLPAEVVALIYRLRWTVEIFFRFFKHVLGCRHLLSHRPDGIEIQVAMAILLCLLITLWTGRKPTLRTVEMFRFHFAGWASDDELESHIAKLQAAAQ